MGDMLNANKSKETSAFMHELFMLCKKHDMCLVPTYEYEPSLHDSLHVIKFNKDMQDFYLDGISVDEDGIPDWP